CAASRSCHGPFEVGPTTRFAKAQNLALRPAIGAGENVYFVEQAPRACVDLLPQKTGDIEGSGPRLSACRAVEVQFTIDARVGLLQCSCHPGDECSNSVVICDLIRFNE